MTLTTLQVEVNVRAGPNVSVLSRGIGNPTSAVVVATVLGVVPS